MLSICPAELGPVQRDMCRELSLSPGRARSPEEMTAAPGLWCDWPVGRLSPLGGRKGWVVEPPEGGGQGSRLEAAPDGTEGHGDRENCRVAVFRA